MASNVPPLPPPPPPGAGLPAPKKVSPVVWILGGCAILVFLAVAAVTVGGLFIAHKARQAGFSPELMQKHPEVAVVKMMVAANPDAELVSVDEDKGIVTVRNKKSGETVTMNFEDIKNGKMSFESGGKKVEMEGHGEGDTGSFTVKSDQGTAKFGAGAVKMPAWLPAYGGASVQGFSSQTAGGSSGTFSFKATDGFDKVAEFYKDALKKAGFTVEVMQHPGGALLTGRTGGRTATVNVTADGAGSMVAGTFEDK
jgi:hypothetical protein